MVLASLFGRDLLRLKSTFELSWNLGKQQWQNISYYSLPKTISPWRTCQPVLLRLDCSTWSPSQAGRDKNRWHCLGPAVQFHANAMRMCFILESFYVA